MERRSFGRRKADRWRLGIGVALGLVLALFFVQMDACDHDAGTQPSPTPTATPRPPVAQPSPTPAATAPPENSKGDNPGPTSVVVDPVTGVATFSNAGQSPHKVNVACTPPAHNDDWGSVDLWVPVGQNTLTYNSADACDAAKIGIDLCRGGESPIQVDYTAGEGEHIGHWANEHSKVVFEANEQYCECEEGGPYEGEPVWIGEPEPGPCPDEEVVTNTVRTCYEHQFGTIETTYDCRDAQTRQTCRQRIVDCPCEEQGPVDVPQVPVWDQSEEDPLEGQCEEEVLPLPVGVQLLNGQGLNCHITGSQTIVEDYTCQEDGERTRTLCKNVECPPPPCEDVRAMVDETGYFCVDNPPGSPESEAAYFGVYDWETFQKTQLDEECWTPDPDAQDVAILKDGRDGCGEGETSYFVTGWEWTATPICPWPDRGNISHVTVFTGKRCED